MSATMRADLGVGGGRTVVARPGSADMAVLTVLSALTSWLSFFSVQGHLEVATLWLMNGMVLGTLLTYPTRQWLVLGMCAFAGNIAGGLLAGLPLVVVGSFSSCNMIEIAAGLAILYRLGDPVEHFTERKSALRIGSGVLLAPVSSCLLAGVVNYTFRHTPFWGTVQQWYIAHAMGLEIMTMLALGVRHKVMREVFSPQRWLGSVGCLLLLVGITGTVFYQSRYPFLFMVFPPLVLAVFVLGFIGMSFGLFAVAVIMVGFTLAGHGPFVLIRGASAATRILTGQAFLLTAVVMTLPIAVALAERKRLEQRLVIAQNQLRRLAMTDQLTGLANRRMFDEFGVREWKRAVREGTCISAIMIDVDLFKLYNDHYGHRFGDTCLIAVAGAIAAVAGRPGDLTARYGGEEFVVMLAGTSREGCVFLAERLRKAVETLQLPHACSPSGRVSISVGTATMSAGAEGCLDGLMDAADRALYEAKAGGRNCVAHAEDGERCAISG